MIVYLVHNRINGKGYVGMTTREFEVRQHEHAHAARADKDNGMAITRAIRKYGIEAFEFTLLEEHASFVDLARAEIRLIAELRTFYGDGQGYNLTRGGEGTPGRVVSEETRRLLSETHKRENLSEETLERMRIAAVKAGGWGRIPVEIEKLRVENMKGDKNPYFRQKTPWKRPGPRSDEERLAMSIRRKGTKLDEAHRTAIGIGVNEYYATHDGPNLGKPWAETTKSKHVALRHLRKKPIFGYDMAGECVIVYLSVHDAVDETGLGWRTLVGDRKTYRRKYVDGITYMRSDQTIAELREEAMKKDAEE